MPSSRARAQARLECSSARSVSVAPAAQRSRRAKSAQAFVGTPAIPAAQSGALPRRIPWLPGDRTDREMRRGGPDQDQRWLKSSLIPCTSRFACSAGAPDLAVGDPPEPDAGPDLKVLAPERGGDRERAQSALAGRGVVALGPEEVRHAGVDLAEAPVVAQVEACALRPVKTQEKMVGNRAVQQVRQPEPQIRLLLPGLAAVGQMGEGAQRVLVADDRVSLRIAQPRLRSRPAPDEAPLFWPPALLPLAIVRAEGRGLRERRGRLAQLQRLGAAAMEQRAARGLKIRRHTRPRDAVMGEPEARRSREGGDGGTSSPCLRPSPPAEIGRARQQLKVERTPDHRRDRHQSAAAVAETLDPVRDQVAHPLGQRALGGAPSGAQLPRGSARRVSDDREGIPPRSPSRAAGRAGARHC